MMLSNRGFSMVELMVGSAVASVVVAGTAAVILNMSTTLARGQDQALIDQLYLEAVQVASNRYNFTDPTVLGMTTTLQACLSSAGVNCRTLSGVPRSAAQAKPLAIASVPSLNASFDVTGPCAAGGNCQVAATRTVTYFWDCSSDLSCAGVRIFISVAQAPSAAQSGLLDQRVRSGEVFIPARDFATRGQVRFSCPTKTTRAIAAVDYSNNVDACATYVSNTTCDMPMANYDQTNSCRLNQTKDCATGFGTSGVFEDQSECAPPAPTDRSVASVTDSAINGACGSANGVSVTSAPSAGLCSAGGASGISGAGPWNWSCAGSGGGTTASCTAPLRSPPINGLCGPSDGSTTSAAPSTNLCSAGTATAVSGSGPWTWTCAGANGGTNASCTANKSTGGYWARSAGVRGKGPCAADGMAAFFTIANAERIGAPVPQPPCSNVGEVCYFSGAATRYTAYYVQCYAK